MHHLKSANRPPTGIKAEPLCRRVGGADLLRLRIQSRLLNNAAVREVKEELLKTYKGQMTEEND